MKTPLTAEGLDMLEHCVQYDPADADKAVTAEKIAKVEAAARDQTIDWLREALDMTADWSSIARSLVRLKERGA